MKLPTMQQIPTEQLKNVAIEAALKALGDDKEEVKRKPKLSAGRAVTAGAVLYAAGLTAFKGRRYLREQLFSNQAEDDEATQTRDEHAEPEAEEYESVDDAQADGETFEEDEELEAADEDGPEAAEDEEPEASEAGDDESDEDGDQPDDHAGDDEPEAATSPPKRKPTPRAAQKKGAKRPRQSRTRASAGRK